ncbi:MAG: alpha/beta hydrolase [Opitutales bacterium]
MRRGRQLRAVFVGVAALAAAAISLQAEKVEKTGERLYYVQVGERSEPETKPGLLVWLHPASGNARPQFKWWKTAGVPPEDFVLLCPQAKGQTWKPNDQRFIEEAIREVSERFDVDPERVFLGGHSSGGFMTYRIAFEDVDAFAGYIVAGAATRRSVPRPGFEPRPFLIYHAKDDGVITYDRAQATREKLEKARYPVTFVEGNHGHSIGPDLAQAMRSFLSKTKSTE